jgi:ABC-type Fe3+/spermidine/putrescine transport system ATPase subunit
MTAILNTETPSPPVDEAAARVMRRPTLELAGLVTAIGRYRSQPMHLRLEPGQTLALIGGNGAGKTTLLETIAGFLQPRAGQVLIAGRDCTHAPPESRRVGYLFQVDALFPHLTVSQNLRFGRLASENLSALLDRFNLQLLAARRPGELSGGERQRVALARALGGNPDVVLLDEPLSAIDPATRPAMRDELARHLRACPAPSIVVTHDPTEALALGHLVGVMNAGELLQLDTAQDAFAHPSHRRSAQLLGFENLWPGVVAALPHHGEVLIRLSTEFTGLVLKVLCPSRLANIQPGTPVCLCVRAANLRVLLPGQLVPEGPNRLRAQLLECTPMASGVQLRCSLEGHLDILAYALPWQLRGWDLQPGQELDLHLDPEAAHVLQD